MLPNRLTWIDEINRSDHAQLSESDKCLFLGEYYAGKGYQGGPTNQLIFNLKCKPSVAQPDSRRQHYKSVAISQAAAGLRSAISATDIEQITWIPVPCSKALGHPDYDDRLEQLLKLAFPSQAADIRPILRQSQSTEADHVSGTRISPQDLFAITELDANLLASRPLRPNIVLFDDVLTTGKHFKCCQRRLQLHVAVGTPIFGIFLARRVLDNVASADEFEDLS